MPDIEEHDKEAEAQALHFNDNQVDSRIRTGFYMLGRDNDVDWEGE